MIETNLPEENDSQSISVLDSDDENGTSACVTHSPRNSSNYQVILLAFRMLEGLVEKWENLRSVDLMVRLDNIAIQGKPCHTKIEQIRSLVAVETFNIHLGGETWSIKII